MQDFTTRVYDGYGLLVGSGVSIDEHGVVSAIAPVDGAVTGGVITPGLVDVHCHGGGGYSFPDDIAPEQIAAAAACHLRRGTTSLIASLVSMVDPLPAIRALADACDAGVLVGIHLEGPYISPHKAGAQNPAAIRGANLDELATWLAAGRGWIKTMTIAPETENAPKAAEMLLAHGAKPSWGHTATDSACTAQAIAAASRYAAEHGLARPAQTATHLFNAMPQIHHREPGPVRELMVAAKRGECVVEVIGDGIHLHPNLVSDVLAILDDPEHAGAVLVTDAMAGAGMPEGNYQLGGLAVTIEGRRAVLTGTDTIAGGVSTLGDQIQIMHAAGVELPRLIRAACATPARALGLDVPVAIEVGQPLTAVVFDAELNVQAVYRNGQLVSDQSR